MAAESDAQNPEISGQDVDRAEQHASKPHQSHGHSPHWGAVKKGAQRRFLSTVDSILHIAKRDKPKTTIPDQTDIVANVGPVIGKVTATSARILIEVDKPGKVTMVLYPDGDPAPLAKNDEGFSENFKKHSSRENGPSTHLVAERTMEAGRPAVFSFSHLEPLTGYRVKLQGCEMRQSSSFRTFAEGVGEASNLNIAVISCNKIFITQKEIPSRSDLWGHLARAIEQGKVDLSLHVGDQIYGDGDKILDKEAGVKPGDWSDCFRKSKALLVDVDQSQWIQHYETVCESYRQVYRMTWGHQYTAYCLANCPNLMIYDDHEVRDNWADLPADWETSTVDFFIALCAWRVNLEYQQQLHFDINFDKLDMIDTDYHFHEVAGVGIMFVDIRGSRTFHRVADDPYKYLGSRQWKDIESSLAAGGIFENVRVLLVCTPAPLVFLESNFTDAFAKRVSRLEDFKGHWSATLHAEEQKKMIDSLCEWKCASGGRDLLVLGGDVHCGGHSEVLRDHKVMFRQLTSSAIANHPLPKSAYYFLRAAETLSGVGQNVTFRHHDWTRSRNYGIVNVKIDGSQVSVRPEITAQLIKGKFMTGIQEGKKVQNSDRSSTGFTKCFGLRG